MRAYVIYRQLDAERIKPIVSHLRGHGVTVNMYEGKLATKPRAEEYHAWNKENHFVIVVTSKHWLEATDNDLVEELEIAAHYSTNRPLKEKTRVFPFGFDGTEEIRPIALFNPSLLSNITPLKEDNKELEKVANRLFKSMEDNFIPDTVQPPKPFFTHAHELATKMPLITFSPEDTISKIVWEMQSLNKNFRHFPIVNGTKLVGLLSRRDILKKDLPDARILDLINVQNRILTYKDEKIGESEIMRKHDDTERLFYIDETTNVIAAISCLSEPQTNIDGTYYISCLPFIDSEDNLLGIMTYVHS